MNDYRLRLVCLRFRVRLPPLLGSAAAAEEFAAEGRLGAFALLGTLSVRARFNMLDLRMVVLAVFLLFAEAFLRFNVAKAFTTCCAFVFSSSNSGVIVGAVGAVKKLRIC